MTAARPVSPVPDLPVAAALSRRMRWGREPHPKVHLRDYWAAAPTRRRRVASALMILSGVPALGVFTGYVLFVHLTLAVIAAGAVAWTYDGLPAAAARTVVSRLLRHHPRYGPYTDIGLTLTDLRRAGACDVPPRLLRPFWGVEADNIGHLVGLAPILLLVQAGVTPADLPSRLIGRGLAHTGARWVPAYLRLINAGVAPAVINRMRNDHHYAAQATLALFEVVPDLTSDDLERFASGNWICSHRAWNNRFDLLAGDATAMRWAYEIAGERASWYAAAGLDFDGMRAAERDGVSTEQVRLMAAFVAEVP